MQSEKYLEKIRSERKPEEQYMKDQILSEESKDKEIQLYKAKVDCLELQLKKKDEIEPMVKSQQEIESLNTRMAALIQQAEKLKEDKSHKEQQFECLVLQINELEPWQLTNFKKRLPSELSSQRDRITETVEKDSSRQMFTSRSLNQPKDVNPQKEIEFLNKIIVDLRYEAEQKDCYNQEILGKLENLDPSHQQLLSQLAALAPKTNIFESSYKKYDPTSNNSEEKMREEKWTPAKIYEIEKNSEEQKKIIENLQSKNKESEKTISSLIRGVSEKDQRIGTLLKQIEELDPDQDVDVFGDDYLPTQESVTSQGNNGKYIRTKYGTITEAQVEVLQTENKDLLRNLDKLRKELSQYKEKPSFITQISNMAPWMSNRSKRNLLEDNDIIIEEEKEESDLRGNLSQSENNLSSNRIKSKEAQKYENILKELTSS